MPTHTDGRYDAEAAQLFALTHARASVVVVIDGAKGNGFSITMADPDPELLTVLAGVLADVAGKLVENARTLTMSRHN